jgi:hypothetical protein
MRPKQRRLSAELDQSLGAIDLVTKGTGEPPEESALSKALAGEAIGLDVVLKIIPAESLRIGT